MTAPKQNQIKHYVARMRVLLSAFFQCKAQ